MTRRPDGRRVVLAVLVPIAAFLGLAAVRIVSQPKLNLDENIFLDVGRHILDTGLPIRSYGFATPSLFFDHTPLYVYFVALLTAIGGPTVLIIRSATLLFGLMTVILVFLIGLEVRGLGSALVGSLLVALNPFFVTYAWFVRMEVPLCFCLVLALYLLVKERFLVAGLAIAAGVMLKEVALAFWLVAVVFVFARRGARAAAIVAIPTPIAFFAWLAYAADIDSARLLATMRRWLGSAAGSDIPDPRLHVGPLRWASAILGQVIGPLMIFAAGAAAALAATSRRSIPSIAFVPMAYVVIAVASSFVIRLKEARFLIAIVPMMALSIALMIDWDDAWARIRRTA